MEAAVTGVSDGDLNQECPEIGNRPSFTPRGERREKRYPIGYSTCSCADVKSLCVVSSAGVSYLSEGVRERLVIARRLAETEY
jgi:hypothetical protein